MITVSSPSNPFSYNAATGQRAAFAGNIIPQSLINPVSKRLLAYYLMPNANVGNGNNLTGSPRYEFKSDQFTSRSDYNLNERNQVFAQGSYLNSPVISPGPISRPRY